MIKKILCLIIYMLIIINVFGQQTSELDLLQKETKNNAIKFDSDNPDFKFLDDLLVDKNIVLIGEASHGHGSAFLFKKEIIEYLNSKHAFTNLVMEGGSPFALNEINNNDSIVDSLKVLEFRRSIFSIWTFSEQFIPTIEYVVQSNMNIIGIESQQSIMNNQHLMSRIKTILKLKSDSSYRRFRMLYFYFIGQQYSYLEKKDNLKFFKNYIKSTIKSLNSLPDSIQDKELLVKSLESLKVSLKNSQLDSRDLKVIPLMNNSRDSMMFQNFLAQYNPNQKYIVWLANFHGVKNIKEVVYNDTSDVYQKQLLFGNYIAEKYKDNAIFFSIVSNYGNNASAFDEKTYSIKSCERCPIVNSTPDNSLDYFIPFNKYSNSITKSNFQFYSIIFGVEHRANWTSQIDGLFILKSMKRSTFYDKPIHLNQH